MAVTNFLHGEKEGVRESPSKGMGNVKREIKRVRDQRVCG